MATIRDEIDEILVDAYGEDEQMSSWEVAFTDGVAVPFQASLLGVPVEVKALMRNAHRDSNYKNVYKRELLFEREQGRWTGTRGILCNIV